jgi:hypothetical protein
MVREIVSLGPSIAALLMMGKAIFQAFLARLDGFILGPNETPLFKVLHAMMR